MVDIKTPKDENASKERLNNNSMKIRGMSAECSEIQSVVEEVPTIDVEDEDEGLPIDRGWAWVVTLAAFHNILITAGYNKAMGLLFIEFLVLFKTSATETALIIGIMAGTFGISVFITMQVLVRKFKIKYIVMTGGLLSGMGIIMSVFANNLLQLIFTQSIFVGIGNSMTHGPALVLIGKYFKKKRATAAAIAASGVSAGAVTFPLLVKYLLYEFGLRGALLLIGGIHLHIIVGAFLMFPIETFHRMKPKLYASSIISKDVVESKENVFPKDLVFQDNKVKITKVLDEAVITESQDSLTNCNLMPNKNAHEPHNISVSNSHLSPLLPHRPRTRSYASRISNFHSQTDISTFTPPDHDKLQEIVGEPCLNEGGSVKRFIESLGFHLWKNPLFLLINLTFALNSFLILFLNYYPAYITDLGTSEQDAANFLSIAGAVDFFCRLASGFVADLGVMKRTHICAIAQLISALNCHMIVLYTSYSYQIIGVVLFGVFSGVYNSFLPVLIMDFLGLDNLPQALGFVMITHGASICAYHPIVGALKDYTGTFVASFHCMGSAVILSAILLVMEPIFRKCSKRTDEKKKETPNIITD